MSEFTKAVLIANIYRYLLIIAGIAFAYMGYRLFKLGYFEKAGELKAVLGEHHLLLKSVAPGVFFAFLGTATIAVGAFRQITVSTPVMHAKTEPIDTIEYQVAPVDGAVDGLPKQGELAKKPSDVPKTAIPLGYVAAVDSSKLPPCDDLHYQGKTLKHHARELASQHEEVKDYGSKKGPKNGSVDPKVPK